jgi:hypothetical protein
MAVRKGGEHRILSQAQHSWDGQTARLAWLARMAAWLGWWLAEAGILVMITIPLSGRPCVRLYEACEHLDAELHGRSQRGRTSDPQSGRAQWHGWWDGLAAWLAWLARMAAWLGRWLAEAGTLLVMIAIPLSGRPCVRLYEACEHLDAELHGRSQRGRNIGSSPLASARAQQWHGWWDGLGQLGHSSGMPGVAVQQFGSAGAYVLCTRVKLFPWLVGGMG